MILLIGARLIRPARAARRGEPLSPSGKERQGSFSLEARPEAEIRLQRHIFAGTGLEARRLQVAVRQPRQVFEPLAQKRDLPRQADVKVGIEGPHHVPPSSWTWDLRIRPVN